MIKNKQTIINNKSGDCFRACVTSVLGIHNDLTLPNVSDKNWSRKWDIFLRKFGIRLIYNNKRIWKEGYWIATVPSKNLKNCPHAIVMKGNCVAFDPSTKKTYEEGIDMIGGDLVFGGFSFEISDAELLHKLEDYKNKI